MSFESYYDAHWLPLGDYFAIHRSRFLQSFKALEALKLQGPGEVLDVGGVGPLAAYLASSGHWTAHQTKSDLRHPLALPDAAFDLVLCTETIEHIKDVESSALTDLEAFNYSGVKQMLLELRRVMKPEGRLLVTTPNACSLLTLEKWLAGHVLLMDPAHVREFTPSDLQRVASECGLATQSMVTVNSWDAQHRRSVTWVAKLLQLAPEVGSIERGDNIVAVFVRA